jgi:glycosyltransferase involved in cell wall biosynthesis
LDKITSFNTDQWVANSYAGKESFVKREGFEPSKISVIYNVSDSKIEPLNKPGVTQSLTLGILSNIKEGKGFKDLGMIVKCLWDNGIDVHLVIGGRDLLEGEIWEYYKTLGIYGRVHYLGYVSDKNLFFNKIDLFILPSYWEGMPTSILESLKFGVPVVATSVGGIPEIIEHKKNGLLFSPGDIDGAVEAVQCYFTSSFYAESALYGLKVVEEKFDNQVLFSKWDQILDGYEAR